MCGAGDESKRLKVWKGQNTSEADWSSGHLPSRVPIWVRCICDSRTYGLDTVVEIMEGKKIPLGFFSQLWQGTEIWYTPTEHQFLALYTPFLQVESLTKEQHHIAVRTSLPLKGWVENMFHWPTSAMAQTPTLTTSCVFASRGVPCPPAHYLREGRPY